MILGTTRAVRAFAYPQPADLRKGYKWYLSERAGHDVDHDAATEDLLALAAG